MLCYYMLCCVVFLCCAVLCCVSCIVLRNSVCVALRLRELFGRAFKHLVLRQIFSCTELKLHKGSMSQHA